MPFGPLRGTPGVGSGLCHLLRRRLVHKVVPTGSASTLGRGSLRVLSKDGLLHAINDQVWSSSLVLLLSLQVMDEVDWKRRNLLGPSVSACDVSPHHIFVLPGRSTSSTIIHVLLCDCCCHRISTILRCLYRVLEVLALEVLVACLLVKANPVLEG